jgi:hypothetical protein
MPAGWCWRAAGADEQLAINSSDNKANAIAITLLIFLTVLNESDDCGIVMIIYFNGR